MAASWHQPTRDYYNAPARLPWVRSGGDWVDRSGELHGDAAFAQSEPVNADGRVELDVSVLVGLWIDELLPAEGFLLRSSGNAGLRLASMEAGESLAPTLALHTKQGVRILRPRRDAYLEPSTGKSMEGFDTLRVDDTRSVLIDFDLPDDLRVADLDKALLEVQVTRRFGNGDASLVAFAARPGGEPRPEMPRPGLAAAFEEDRGIRSHPDVVFASQFDPRREGLEWGETLPAQARIVDAESAGVEALSGGMLEVTIPQGQHTGLNGSLDLATLMGEEPDAIYFRYYLRMGEGWAPAQGGKIPGISGDYGVAGWGGRRSNGSNGWSMRGRFGERLGEGNPFSRGTPLGFYAYHAGMRDFYGDNWIWSRDARGVVEHGRWYCIEQFVQMNTPGQPDGVARAWVDGRLAFEKTDIIYRTSPSLHVERVWLNVYHGGAKPAPQDLRVHIDSVVVATSYIGPMNRGDESWWLSSR